MNRFFYALIGTCLEVLTLSVSVMIYTYNKDISSKIVGLIGIIIITLIMLKINYEYFESPFYKNLKT